MTKMTCRRSPSLPSIFLTSAARSSDVGQMSGHCTKPKYSSTALPLKSARLRSLPSASGRRKSLPYLGLPVRFTPRKGSGSAAGCWSVCGLQAASRAARASCASARRREMGVTQKPPSWSVFAFAARLQTGSCCTGWMWQACWQAAFRHERRGDCAMPVMARRQRFCGGSRGHHTRLRLVECDPFIP